ncbi:hypothetical protein LY78DRAFT_63835 [Colletotrichum sublineola]|nr:hypothetical protein LY78DRAFT_63835 [Colletotrichum sublineola]
MLYRPHYRLIGALENFSKNKKGVFLYLYPGLLSCNEAVAYLQANIVPHLWFLAPFPPPLFCTIFSLASLALSLHKIVSAQLRRLPRGTMEETWTGLGLGARCSRHRGSFPHNPQQSEALLQDPSEQVSSEAFPPLAQFWLFSHAQVEDGFGLDWLLLCVLPGNSLRLAGWTGKPSWVTATLGNQHTYNRLCACTTYTSPPLFAGGGNKKTELWKLKE